MYRTTAKPIIKHITDIISETIFSKLTGTIFKDDEITIPKIILETNA